MASSKPTRCACRLAALVLVALVFLVPASAAHAHIIHVDGVWTYRYLTRANQTDCGSASTGSDPLNVLFWQYGEGGRMNTHAEQDTDWGFYNSSWPRADQWICGDSDGNPEGNYTVNDAKNFDDQEGHGGIACTCLVRAHFRIFYAPHAHSALVDKWSTIDVHHEHLTTSGDTGLNHYIDEDWETWEYHIVSEFAASGHSTWYDYWARQGGQYLQGHWDDGSISRVGGLHNGVY